MKENLEAQIAETLQSIDYKEQVIRRLMSAKEWIVITLLDEGWKVDYDGKWFNLIAASDLLHDDIKDDFRNAE